MPLKLKYIIQAFQTLGGEAKLRDLYREVERIHDRRREILPQNWEDNVRDRIYVRSSDSDIFNVSGEDLFQKIERGHWALREQTWDGEILDGVEPFMTEEGRRLLRMHLKIERSAKLIREFKNSLGPNLYCSICGLDFEERYGKLGEGYIEAHHKVPLSSANSRAQASIEDLIAVCANCHRVLHRNPLDDKSVRKLRRVVSSRSR